MNERTATPRTVADRGVPLPLDGRTADASVVGRGSVGRLGRLGLFPMCVCAFMYANRIRIPKPTKSSPPPKPKRQFSSSSAAATNRFAARNGNGEDDGGGDDDEE